MKFRSAIGNQPNIRTIIAFCVIFIGPAIAENERELSDLHNEVVDDDLAKLKAVVPKEPKFFDEFDCKYYLIVSRFLCNLRFKHQALVWFR